jgi:glycosyltransferase involved in cell wall biosynthesis
MAGPLVSIVIDNYNYGAYVGAAIRSALDQTYANKEVVVVDDGSTDNSREVIEGFGERIVKVFKTNGGQTSAFNAGFAASKGEIVLFLDSDDALRADAVAEVVAAWRPGIVKAQFCLSSVDAGGRFLGNIFPNFASGLTTAEMRDEALRTGLYPCPPTSGNAYARTYLEQVMPLPHIQCGADGPLNTVAPLYGEIVTVNKPLGYYRVHGRNDGAQAALAADRIARLIRMDQFRIGFLREHAAKLGIPIEGEPLDRAVINLQYRLASLKALPDRHPVAGESIWRVVGHAARAMAVTRDRLPQRIATLGWFVAVAVSPAALANLLIALRFVPASRPKFIAAVLRRLGVLRRADAAPAELSLPERLAVSS